MQVILRLFFCFIMIGLPVGSAFAITPDEIATEILAPLLDPAKIATLKGDRPINSRFYKVLCWVETARQKGGEISSVIDTAQATAGYRGTNAAKADKKAIIYSRAALEELGCFTPEGLEKLRRGNSPTVTEGAYKGDTIALDHVLPRSVVPELAARFYNLEGIPSRLNLAKSAKIGARELAVARDWQKNGLLTATAFDAVEAAFK